MTVSWDMKPLQKQLKIYLFLFILVKEDANF